jgi:hypothetical protein
MNFTSRRDQLSLLCAQLYSVHRHREWGIGNNFTPFIWTKVFLRKFSRTVYPLHVGCQSCSNHLFYCIYLFIIGLFNDAVHSPDYTASNESIISESWIGKDVEGSGRGLMWGTIPEFTWKDWKNIWNTWDRINGISTRLEPRDSGHDLPTDAMNSVLNALTASHSRLSIGTYWFSVLDDKPSLQ